MQDTSAHYVDWCSIFAGAVISTAVAAVLFTFGTAIGLSMVSPYEGEGVSGAVYLATLGLWTVWVVVSSSMAGGYAAGRLRRRVGDASEHEVEVRDGAHGLIVWGTGIIFAGVLLAMGVSGVLGAASKATGAGAAVAATDPDARSKFTVDSLFRAPARAAAAPATTDTTASGDTTMNAAMSSASGGSSPGMSTPTGRQGASVTEERAEVGRLLTFGLKKGELSADNKAYVARLVAQRTGMSQAEAEQRVTQVLADTKAAADKARKSGIIIGFLTAAALLVAGAAAAWAADLGGRHRDRNTDHSAFWRWPA